jgi:predicted dehydrogenase
MSKPTLNIAMVGSGFIGKAHSNAFRQVGHFFDSPYKLHLKALCGRSPAKAEAAAAQWGWDETATDWRQVVGRKDIDVVDIAVPNALHAPIAIAAAEAGKIVWCEKPLATSLSEAEKMAAAARGVANLVWFNYRRIPAVAFARQLLDEGRLGQIFHYRALYLNQSGNDPTKAAAWRYKKSEAGTGAAGDLLSHLVDLALYLNGTISQLSAMMHTFASQRDVDDATLLLTRFANKSIGSFEATRYGVGHQNRNSFEINASKGMLRFSLDDMNGLEYSDVTERANLQGPRRIIVTGPNHPYWENFWKPGHPIGYEHTFIATLADFLASMARGETFHPNFENALEVQRVLDAAEHSAKSGVWVRL